MKEYRYKLNMLEPGTKMIKLIVGLIILSVIFYFTKLIVLCYLVSILAGITGFILWVLIMIEQHQDRVLNEQAIEERRRNGED
ncbi:hypothetical protein [Candidatus Galacturonibacter soehngenii]|uniref:Uncharacterized protein n=1 Tax=Candidatus Galacturonatibacter soehngenii TaxID=2307010 RepID=A0A7V7QIV4_9FIRM|nr:hypothetical protein [Candidatus Galacturonibacter soehngenii]KAB1437468.1 hypothetical protein F7O84_07600 [Candidatus Galacturonibacter soehngenii]